MKKIILSFLLFITFINVTKAQYNSIMFSLIEEENFMGVARKYLVNTNPNNSDEVNYHISLIKIASEIQSKARNTSLPFISQNFNNATPIDLFGGKFEMYKYNFGESMDKINPTPSIGLDKLRLIIIRPKDNLQRPCVLVTHGLGACTNTDDPFYDFGIDFLSIPDLLMRGYTIVYYENVSTCRMIGNTQKKTWIESNYKLNENVNVDGSYWQRYDLLALLNSTAAAKFTSGISAKINISPYLYTLGHSFGGFSALNLALADPGLNYNNSIFTYLTNNNPNFTYFTLDEFKNSPIPIIGATVLASALPDPNISTNKMGNFFDNSDKFVGISMMNGKQDQNVPIEYGYGIKNWFFPWLSTLSVEGPIKLIDRINPIGMNNALFVNCYGDHQFYARPTGYNPASNDITLINQAINQNSNFPANITNTIATKWNGYTKYHQQQYEFDSYTTILYQLYLFNFISICFDAYGLPTPCNLNLSIQEYVRPQACTAYPNVCNINDSWQLTTCNPATGNRLANDNINIEETIKSIEDLQEKYSLISSNPKLPASVIKRIENLTNPKLKDAGISIYPNPAKEVLTIHFDKVLNNDVTVDVVDITGKIVSSSIIKQHTFDSFIEVKSLASGVYLINLYSSDFNSSTKFVKE